MSPSPEWQRVHDAAYASAAPDVSRYIDAAAWELLRERNPTRSQFYEKEQTELLRTDSPSVVERAEHLSRSSQAYEAAEAARVEAAAAEADAAREAERRERETCPLCGEFPRHLSSLPHTAPGIRQKACETCRDLARLLHTEHTRTKAREAAVRAALKL